MKEYSLVYQAIAVALRCLSRIYQKSIDPMVRQFMSKCMSSGSEGPTKDNHVVFRIGIGAAIPLCTLWSAQRTQGSNHSWLNQILRRKNECGKGDRLNVGTNRVDQYNPYSVWVNCGANHALVSPLVLDPPSLGFYEDARNDALAQLQYRSTMSKATIPSISATSTPATSGESAGSAGPPFHLKGAERGAQRYNTIEFLSWARSIIKYSDIRGGEYATTTPQQGCLLQSLH